MNVNRLVSHFSFLESHCAARCYDALAVTETFLTQSEFDEHLTLDGNNYFIVDRKGQL